MKCNECNRVQLKEGNQILIWLCILSFF
ncbi:TPA: tetracycline resistance efflux system leader peptide, partial [Clostridioides difficile]|nr:tetracycline resistance efflux system leader peptide [Clostridioides difficile]HBG4761434.1 tetracycline resistance efflux system leader peptide [Clostridioides difficile]HBY2887525.1 tetracycline resistance efflux system leader peptide [Clostridioides difficile]